VKKDCARVIKENNALHVQIIQQAEEHNEKQMEHYQRVKELETEISELSFWKHQAQNRLELTEKENASIKERLKDVMNLGGFLSSASFTLCRIPQFQSLMQLVMQEPRGIL
jgi:chromosome segregation ATPase